MRFIKLSLGKKTKVDDDVFDQYGHLSWNTKPHGQTFYAKRKDGKTTIYLHRLIMKPPKGHEVDHIDGNGLNNLRSNLRIGSHRQNMRNIHVFKTSRYHGVYWNPAAKKWQAYAQHKRKSIYLGVFVREEDAAAKSLAFCRSLPQ